MKQGLIFAGAAMLAFAGAAHAKPPHGKLDKGQKVKVVEDRGHFGHQAGHCPRGLAKKNAACMPPGQYKKLF